MRKNSQSPILHIRVMKRCLIILVAALVLVVIVILASCRSPAQEDNGPDRAAIVDQLYLREANPVIIAGITQILESYGFEVDLWQGAQITVDFYRELPRRGYKLIVFRVHSGLLLSLEGEEVKPLEGTYLFTAENYTTTKYVSEQLADKVTNAMMAEDFPLIFAVNSKFIRDTKGDFNNTVIIAMGCESYYFDDLPTIFIEKGASAYIGWNTIVSLEYVDAAMLNLLNNLCTGNMTLTRGIESTMDELGYDPYFNAYLKLYPPESGSKTISELIE